MLIERTAQMGLPGHEPVLPDFVMLQNELHPGRAKTAMAVEDDDRPCIGKAGHSIIVAIAVGLSQGSNGNRFSA